MSFTDTRAALATALSSVTGVTGYEFRPSTIAPGAAWPLLESANRGPGDAFSASWVIVLVTGGDERTATDFADAVLPELVDEIDPFAYVESVTPATVPTDQGNLLAVEIRCTSE